MSVEGTAQNSILESTKSLEMSLMSQLETEISSLLGSIKVRASSIKKTLQKQKNTLQDSDDEGKRNEQSSERAIELSDVRIEVFEDDNDSTAEHNQSDQKQFPELFDDAYSCNSVVSVIRVGDSFPSPRRDSDIAKGRAG